MSKFEKMFDIIININILLWSKIIFLFLNGNRFMKVYSSFTNLVVIMVVYCMYKVINIKTVILQILNTLFRLLNMKENVMKRNLQEIDTFFEMLRCSC